MDKIAVNVVAFEDEPGVWIAHCVEYDIVAKAQSLQDLPKAFERVLISNLCVNSQLGHRGLDGIPPSPERIRTMFENAAFQSRRSQGQELSGASIQIDELRVAV